MNKKRLSFVLAMMTAFGALSVAGCATGTTASQSAIQIGGIGELTGDIPAVGASYKNAAEMAVKEINDAGGLDVGGQKYTINLSIEDNAGKADQAASAATKLITQQNVVAIVGPNASRYAIPASQIAESSKVMLISPWSTNPKLTLVGDTTDPKQYVFRAAFIDDFQGQVVARFAQDTIKATKAAVLYDVASEYNKGIAEVFKKSFTDIGGQVVAFETYTTNDKDFTAQLTKIKAAEPDVVFLPNYYSEVPLQVQQAKRLGIDVPFLGSDSWGSAELLKLCGADCEGYYFSTHYAADNASPTAKAFIDAYTATYGATPDDVAALTYDSFKLLYAALTSAGKVDRQAVRDAMAKISDFEGVTGTMQFQGTGDPVKSAVILQVKDGKFVYFANAKP